LIQTWVQLEPSGQIGRVSFRLAYIVTIWANYKLQVQIKCNCSCKIFCG